MTTPLHLSRASIAALLFLAPSALPAQGVGADPDFDPAVPCPAYGPGAGPAVLVDEAHRNYHTAGERYAAFARVAGSDGYRVAPWTEPFTAALPERAILVVANARGADEPSTLAFTPEEVEAVRRWVEAGGSLFLIADHSPFGSAALNLAAAFGVEMLDGHVRDEERRAEELPGPFFLEFTTAEGLGDHPVLRGRGPHEALERVVTFGGQALSAGPEATVLLRFGPGAELVENPGSDTPPRPVAGLAQGVAVEVGRGRVVVAGEAALFGAQLIQGETARNAGLPDPFHFGMNHPGTDDKQLLLNVLHWLSGLL